MLFPEDPVMRPQLWEALLNQLARDEVCFVVDNGVGNTIPDTKRLSTVESKELIQRMQNAAICRISANHGNAIGPHFSGVVVDQCITITDFVVARSQFTSQRMLEQIQCDFETAALNLLYGPDSVEFVRIPVELDAWYSRDLNIREISGVLEFCKSS